MIHDDLEIVFADIHDRILPEAKFPVKIDDIANVVKASGAVHRIEYIASDDLSRVNGVLRKIYHHPSDEFVGQIYHKPDKQIRESNYCWSRFTKAKELAHLLIDESDQEVQDEKTIREIAAWSANQSSGPMFENRRAIDSELWGLVAAIEILFPISWRQALIIGTYTDKYSYTDHGIALLFRIPELYVAGSLGIESHTRLLRIAVQNNPERFGYLQGIWDEFLTSL